MVSLDDAASMALDLPEVTEGERHGNRTWFVNGKGFVWERPFSKADIRRFGDAPIPVGPILALRVDDMEEKAAVLAAQSRGFFDMAHFEGYPAVLVELRKAAKTAVREAILDAWLACAPPALAEAHLARRSGRGR